MVSPVELMPLTSFATPNYPLSAQVETGPEPPFMDCARDDRSQPLLPVALGEASHHIQP